jgi:hypothetical protein
LTPSTLLSTLFSNTFSLQIDKFIRLISTTKWRHISSSVELVLSTVAKIVYHRRMSGMSKWFMCLREITLKDPLPITLQLIFIKFLLRNHFLA